LTNTEFPDTLLLNIGEILMGAVNTPRDFAALEKHLSMAEEVAFDTETDSLSHHRQMIGFSVATRDGAWYIPVAHKEWDASNVHDIPMEAMRKQALAGDNKNVPKEHALRLLTALFTDPNKHVWIHNAKFDVHVLRNFGIDPLDIKAKILDSMMLSWLINPERPHGLKVLVKQYLNYQMTTFEEVSAGWGSNANVPVHLMAAYASDDVKQLLPLAWKMLEELAAMGDTMLKVFYELECPMVMVLEDMVDVGFLIDTPYLKRIREEMVIEQDTLLKKMAELLQIPPEQVKLGSTQWLSKTFIEQLKWWGIRSDWVRGKNGCYSTASGVLEQIAEGQVPGTTPAGVEAVRLILRHRTVGKLVSTYTNSLYDVVDANGRLHASFLQHGTATGRFSSSAPNLQNIPREPKPEEELPSIRRAFIPRQGFKMLGVDYSQIELRLAAHFSADPIMLHIYQTNGDIHQKTADECGCSRQHAKGINFGLIYGMGPKKLAEVLKIPESEARLYHRRYFQTYAGIGAFQAFTQNMTRKQGYVSTLIGRRRYLPDINSSDWKVKGPAERQAVNTKVQGSAADLIKISMRNLRNKFIEDGVWRKDVFMLSQVHDELLFEVREGCEEYVMGVIKEQMEGSIQLRVPLIAEPKIGGCWAETK